MATLKAYGSSQARDRIRAAAMTYAAAAAMLDPLIYYTGLGTEPTLPLGQSDS